MKLSSNIIIQDSLINKEHAINIILKINDHAMHIILNENDAIVHVPIKIKYVIMIHVACYAHNQIKQISNLKY